MPKIITVFEHQVLKLNQNTVCFDEQDLKALQLYYGEIGVPYFSLVHNGIRFNEYVGVIQIGNTIIEVLPKADNTISGTEEKHRWRDILIDMLFAVGVFDINSTSISALKLKSHTILDLYIALFIKEVEYLLHNGLVKQYRNKEENTTALKGCLKFSKNIQQNFIHHERFYVRHTVYDLEHQLHFILYKTIRLLKQINTSASLHGRIGALLLYFPEMPEIKVSEETFNNLVFTRKTQSYKNAINIARLLLLHYHPDFISGRNHVLALMFDMNDLWEKFVYVSLHKHKKIGTTLTAQNSKNFWQPKTGYSSKIRPDIVVNKDQEHCVVLDTKWKNLNDVNPSPDDLRQMYVYHHYYQANRVALIYPGTELNCSDGAYLDHITEKANNKVCAVITIPVIDNIKAWQEAIYKQLENWWQLSDY